MNVKPNVISARALRTNLLNYTASNIHSKYWNVIEWYTLPNTLKRSHPFNVRISLVKSFRSRIYILFKLDKFQNISLPALHTKTHLFLFVDFLVSLIRAKIWFALKSFRFIHFHNTHAVLSSHLKHLLDVFCTLWMSKKRLKNVLN